jgi:hypothetical protein
MTTKAETGVHAEADSIRTELPTKPTPLSQAEAASVVADAQRRLAELRAARERLLPSADDGWVLSEDHVNQRGDPRRRAGAGAMTASITSLGAAGRQRLRQGRGRRRA